LTDGARFALRNAEDQEPTEGLPNDADQRAVVANALLESLHEGDHVSDIDAAWRTEATRRLAEVRAGDVELVEADEHYDRLRASLTE
jgi:hypothetical protein